MEQKYRKKNTKKHFQTSQRCWEKLVLI